MSAHLVKIYQEQVAHARAQQHVGGVATDATQADHDDVAARDVAHCWFAEELHIARQVLLHDLIVQVMRSDGSNPLLVFKTVAVTLCAFFWVVRERKAMGRVPERKSSGHCGANERSAEKEGVAVPCGHAMSR